MAAKKDNKKLTAVEKQRVEKALRNVEDRLVEGYRSAAANVSGKSLRNGTKKIKANVSKARKRIEAEVKKNPAGATVAAAVLGAIAGALIVSKLKKR